jgi:hypothetical protein
VFSERQRRLRELRQVCGAPYDLFARVAHIVLLQSHENILSALLLRSPCPLLCISFSDPFARTVSLSRLGEKGLHPPCDILWLACEVIAETGRFVFDRKVDPLAQLARWAGRFTGVL